MRPLEDESAGRVGKDLPEALIVRHLKSFPMSYIKSAVVFDGIARIVEVHGATWCYLDVQGGIGDFPVSDCGALQR